MHSTVHMLCYGLRQTANPQLLLCFLIRCFCREMGKKDLLPQIPDDVEMSGIAFSLNPSQLDPDDVADTDQLSDTLEPLEEASVVDELDCRKDDVLDGTRHSRTEETAEALATASDREDGESSSSPPVSDMDSLLMWCFLFALRARVRRSDLPLLTSTLYSELMQQCW